MFGSQDSTAAFDLPIAAADEPGLTVTASFIRAGEFLPSSEKYVKAPQLEHQINVKLSTDKAQYLPGQTADYRSLEAIGSDGKPAPHAGVQPRHSG